MFVTPDSEIEIFIAQPLDKDNKHTFLFETRQAQNDYFEQHVYQVVRNYSFIKEDKSVNIQIDRTIFTYADIAQCNYMRFKNTAFYNKWFYAFIDSVELVNIGCAKIHFTIDVMQTWLPNIDYQFEPTFIEREHSITDVIGDNLIEEDLEVGNYVMGRQQSPIHYDEGTHYLVDLTHMRIVIAIGEHIDITNLGGGSYSFAATGEPAATYYGEKNVGAVQYICFESDSAGLRAYAQIMDWLANQGKIDEILCIFWFPAQFTEPEIDNEGTIHTSGSTVTDIPIGSAFAYDVVIPADFRNDTSISQNNIDGYVPKNNKLFTYPYNFLQVITPSGTKIFKYELFDGAVSEGNCYFTFYGAVSPSGSIQIYPLLYARRAALGTDIVEVENSVSVSGFPQITFNNDLMKAYVAQKASEMGSRSYIGQLIMNTGYNMMPSPLHLTGSGEEKQITGYGSVVKSGLSGVSQFFNDVANVNRRIHQLEVAPVRVNGDVADVTGLQIGAMQPFFVNKHITAEFAKIIDDYFTMFGYACRRVKTPALHNRTNYTFIKTKGIHFHLTAFPANIGEEIASIFNSGITFWVNPSNIGNYNIDNRPLGEV